MTTIVSEVPDVDVFAHLAVKAIRQYCRVGNGVLIRIDAQHPVLPGIHTETGTDDLRPPSLARGIRDYSMGGNTAENRNHRCIRRTREPEGDPRIGQGIAMMQREWERQPQGFIDLN